MKRTHLLGIDIGTQGTKTVLFDRRGRTVASGVPPVATAPAGAGHRGRGPRVSVQDRMPGHQGIVWLPREPSIRHGLRRWGSTARWRGLWASARMDGTSPVMTRGWIPAVRRTSRGCRSGRAIEIIRKTGGPASFNHGPKILWWKHEHPEIYEQIAAFVQPGGYVAMRLCGMDDRGLSSTGATCISVVLPTAYGAFGTNRSAASSASRRQAASDRRFS
jgi:xylulokinase